MDIARPDQKRKRRRRQIAFAFGAVLVLGFITIRLAQLKPAAPSVDRETLYFGKVDRGPMVRQVRGNGTLVPEQIRSITARHPGRVEEILVKVGAAVTSETILLKLSNPELEQAVFDAEWTLKGAEAELINLKVSLDSQRLNLQASAASAEANASKATMDAEVNQALAKDGLVPQLTLKQSLATAGQLENLSRIEARRLAISAEAFGAQLAVQEARVQQLRAQLDLRRSQLASLEVRAGIDGVLQRLGTGELLQVGDQVGAGSFIARVANPKRLMAEIKIPETQARDVELGQSAEIDTRNGKVSGTVVRIDPAATQGTVTVDVRLSGALPKGARPELSVDGIIELERLEDVLFVGRPVIGQSESTVGLFRVTENGREAVRTPVKLGRSSVSFIEVINGLTLGQEVILSDMSTWDGYDRVRLN
ncbi:MAG: HlyD family efflux transporter periplasmic adaptor subunit [Verrucomicrobia bacterium]|nr:HlyD family efflux transporter periplasmic adaptor subunit [Verrucomicrobiota bacterium]